MKFELPPLPYAYEALAPIISAETLHLHHDKHHAAYVTKLNALVPGTKFENSTLEQIVKEADGPLFNQAGQTWNHTFYWNSMAPVASAKKTPGAALGGALTKEFGALDGFKKEFEKKGTELFGSGWVWLALDAKGKLEIVQTKDAENPIRQGMKPIFVCDVWEHAYYVDYKNERPKYLGQFWDLVNWDFAEKNFTAAS